MVPSNICTWINLNAQNLFSQIVSSVDVRGKDFSRAEKWSDESVFNNRAYFEPDSKAASLVLDSVTEKDAAIYRCRVDFKYAQTRNSKVNLTVVGKKQVGKYLWYYLV